MKNSKILSFILTVLFLLQIFASVQTVLAADADVAFADGVYVEYDSNTRIVSVNGSFNNYADYQNVTVLAVKQGSNLNKLEIEDIYYVKQYGTVDGHFEFDFKLSKGRDFGTDVYLGGTNVTTPFSASFYSDMVLVDSIDIDVNSVTATAFMRNMTDEEKSAVMLLAQYGTDSLLLDVKKETKTIPANTVTPVSCTVCGSVLNDGAKTLRCYVWCDEDNIMPLALPEEVRIYSGSFKILAVGNSFSEDATAYLYQIAANYGIKNIIVGNLYYGGCSLQMHWNWAANNSSPYTYYKNTSGTFTSSNSSLLNALTDEDWDIIVMQQVSGLSGKPDSYEPYLTNLKNFIMENKTNPDAKLAWHMTWAYQGNSTHSDFAKYNNNQMTMYNAIVDTVNEKIVPDDDFEYIIPSGTSIQNMRTSYVGDNLTRDGFHMSIPLGRYITGLTWFKTFTGASLNTITYAPSGVDNVDKAAAKEAVDNAYKNPFGVTNSTYATNEMDLSNYEEMNYNITLKSYYNSSGEGSTRNIGTDDFHSRFASTDIFSKTDLPVGSIIAVNAGYQYRPEGWTALGTNTSPRPDNVTTKYVEVTDAWWGSYNYRAFNISKTGGGSIADTETVKSNFKIYIPK